MPTTTIRLEDALKSRLAAAAQRAGLSPHAFILQALEASVAQAEQDAAFQALAESRWAALVASGESVGWPETRAWLEARARGEAAPRPLPRKPGD